MIELKNIFEVLYTLFDYLVIILTPIAIALNIIGIIKNKNNPKKKSKYYNVTTKITLITQIIHILYLTFYTINYFSVYILIGLIVLYIVNIFFIKKLIEEKPRKKQLTTQLLANGISILIILLTIILDILKMIP